MILILLFAGVTALNAQQMINSLQGAERFILQHGDELNLTEDQKQQMLSMGIERRSQTREVRTERMQPRRGAAIQRGERGGQRAERGQRNDRRVEGQRLAELYQNILTDEQMQRLTELRNERNESMQEVRILRNRVAVEHAGIDEPKRTEVIEILDRRTTIMAGLDWQRGQRNSNLQESMPELRELQDELKNLLSAAEYEKLQQTMAPIRGPGQRAGMMRRGR